MTSYKIDGFQIYEYSSQNPQAVIFFAHANGIPANTYAKLWENVAKILDVRVISYDMRGIGNTTLAPIYNDDSWGWKILVDDHIALFERIKKSHPKNTRFILMGHSVGAWLSLLSTRKLGDYPIILCDPPLLYKRDAIGWFLLHLLKKKNYNPKSKKVLKRKISFESFDAACETFKKSTFLAKWDNELLKEYIRGSFHEDDKTKKLFLRHTPEWEAYIFSQYPPTAAQGFLQLPKKLRNELKPIFLVGSLSDACNPKAKTWVKFFFPHLKWIVIPNVGHMFPIENQNLMINTLKNLI